MNSLIDARRIYSSNDPFELDPNDLDEETLVVAGSCTLSRTQTRKLWAKELLSFRVFNNLETCTNLDDLLPADVAPQGCGALTARCPWAPVHAVPRVAPERALLPQGVAFISYDPTAGLFQGWRVVIDGASTIVRLVSAPVAGWVEVSICPAVHRQLARFFPGHPAISTVQQLARVDRCWHRTPGEVAITSPAALPTRRVRVEELDRSPVVVATPPYIPALLTVELDADMVVHETAVVRPPPTRENDEMVPSPPKLEPVVVTPLSTVLANLEKHVLRFSPKIPKVAQNTMRLSVLSRALSIKFDSITDFLVIDMHGFGLRKLFSLDISGCLDAYEVRMPPAAMSHEREPRVGVRSHVHVLSPAHTRARTCSRPPHARAHTHTRTRAH